MIEKIKTWLVALFNTTKRLTNKYLPIAVSVVQAVKKAIESGSVDFILDVAKLMIPSAVVGDGLEKAVAFAKDRIPTLCLQLEILDAVNMNGGDAEVLQLALDTLKETYGEKWEAFTSGLAGDILEHLVDDGRIDASEAMELAKAYYDEYIK